MKTQKFIGLVLLTTMVASGLVSGCSDKKSTSTKSDSEVANNALSKNQNQVQGARFFVGELSETFNAGGYTYVNVATSAGNIWAAGPITALKKGDKLSFASKMLMKNFRSTALKRDFKEIYFVKVFTVNGIRMDSAPKAAMYSDNKVDDVKNNPHNSGSMSATTQAAVALKPVKKAAKGQSIADIIANANTFRDKTVTVRGQVTKVTPNILGTNWIHIRDNSTAQDLTITSSGTTKVGDIILVKGKLVLGKDFGKGFVMERVVDNAAIKVE